MSDNPYSLERQTTLSLDFTFPMRVVTALLFLVITTVILWAVQASMPILEAVTIGVTAVCFLVYQASKYYRQSHRMTELFLLLLMPVAPVYFGGKTTVLVFMNEEATAGHVRFWRHVWLLMLGLIAAQVLWLMQSNQWNLWPVIATFMMVLIGVIAALF